MDKHRIHQAREICTLFATGGLYWGTIYPRARRELKRWKRRALQIPDPLLRAHALHKLTSEHLNPEAAAFFAVLAPRRSRPQLTRLIVAFQVAYDYLDAINEPSDASSTRNGMQLHRALSDAVRGRGVPYGDYYRYHPLHGDGGYLEALVEECRHIAGGLASIEEIEPILDAAAIRCGEGQSRNHALLLEGDGQLIKWTSEQTGTESYLWWETAAAGISCLAVHALFAAAADETTISQARAIDRAYFPPVCAVSALLDSLIDSPDDKGTTIHSFVAHYISPEQTAERLTTITTEACQLTNKLPYRRRHKVVLAGIIGFYLSAAEASLEDARPATQRTLACVRPVVAPILAVQKLMRR